MSHAFHKSWLKITAIVVGSFGPIFFLGTIPETTEPARWSLDLLSWPVDGATTYESADTRFLSALTGGFLLGWGLTIWCLSVYVYDAAPEGVRKSVVFGALAWFVLDSAGSVASGNPSNLFFKFGSLVLKPCSGACVMTLFRIFLAALLAALLVYTLMVGQAHGWNLIPPFFAEIQAMSWQGQFNFDFAGFLLLSALWCAWRNAFSLGGLLLSLLAATGGILFLATYLLYLSFKTGGDIPAMLLGAQLDRDRA